VANRHLAGLARPIEEEFGTRVHPRSVERALARQGAALNCSDTTNVGFGASK